MKQMMKKYKKYSLLVFVIIFIGTFLFTNSAYAESIIPYDLIDLQNQDGSLNSSVQLFLLVTVLSLSSSIVLMFSHFTFTIIVLSLTRQGMGTQTMPPNQVLVGLALFLALFMMQPVLSELNDEVWQPIQNNEITTPTEIIERTAPILRNYMIDNVYDHDINMMLNVLGEELPENADELSLFALVPAFVLTQMQQGLMAGMFIYLAFIFIDLIVSTILMYLGMMMLPPMIISLPFKILTFVYIGGYSRIVEIIFNTITL